MKKEESFWHKKHDLGVLTKYIVSNYNEVTVFLLFLALLFALFEYSAIGGFSMLLGERVLDQAEILEMLIYIVPVLLGGVESAYYALHFNKSPLKKEVRMRMLFFGIVIEFIAATLLAFNSNLDTWYGMTLFIFNFVHIAVLMQLFGTEYLNEKMLTSSHNGKPLEVLSGVIIVTALFYGLRYGYDQTIGIAFSTSVIYVAMVNNVISKIFVKRGNHASIE